jgi:hypothetical protein
LLMWWLQGWCLTSCQNKITKVSISLVIFDCCAWTLSNCSLLVILKLLTRLYFVLPPTNVLCD